VQIATLLVSSFVIAGAVLSAQDDSSQGKKTGEIHGTVIEGSSNNPVHRALVVLRKGEEPGLGTYTDAAGKFTFHHVDPGAYLFSVEHDGFVTDAKSRRQTVTVTAGEAGEAITLKLTRTGAVSGRVMNAEGEPVMGAMVQFQPSNTRKPQQGAVGYGTSDDRGYYRAYNIPPGRYRLSVTYSSRRGQPITIQDEQGKAKDGSVEGYGTTYYPGTLDSSQAGIVQIDPGADLEGIDIGLLHTRTVRVKGRIGDNGGSGLATSLVMLFLTPLTGGEALDTRVHPDSTFEFAGVVPGKYLLGAMQVLSPDKQLTANREVEVGETDVEGVELMLGRAQTVSGSVVMPSDRKLKPGLVTILQSRNPSQQFVSTQAGGFGQVNEKGGFSIEHVAPGDYDLVLGNMGQGDDLYVGAIRSGDQDVLASGLHIGAIALPPIEIALKANGAEIDCSVVDEKQQPAPEAIVTLLPDPPRRSQVALRAECHTDAAGKCTLLGVAPGDYHAFTYGKDDSADFRDPDTMARIEKLGIAVSVALGDKKPVQFQIVQLDEQGH
jgi:protocatechuate 3,4-dioxygenase beta subunit